MVTSVGQEKSNGNYTSIDQLVAVLDWLLKQRADSAFSHFFLFRVGFEDPRVLGSTFGAAGAMRRLNEFGAALAATVRRTDQVARSLSEFWIAAPDCNPDMVCCRLCEIAHKAEEFGLDVVECSVSAYKFPVALPDVKDARTLLDRLKSVTPTYCFDPAKECAMRSAEQSGATPVQWSGRTPHTCVRAQAS
jgi:hypothetical protein